MGGSAFFCELKVTVEHDREPSPRFLSFFICHSLYIYQYWKYTPKHPIIETINGSTGRVVGVFYIGGGDAVESLS